MKGLSNVRGSVFPASLITVVLFLFVFGLGWAGSSQGSQMSSPTGRHDTDRGRMLFMNGASDTSNLVLQPGPEGKDSYVDSWAPGANDGNSEWFMGIGLISNRAGFIQFDLSSIPAGSTILSATITLWGAYHDGQIYFRPVALAWDEMAITWNNQPTTVPVEISYPISRGAPSGPCYWGCAWPFDITGIVQYWIDNSSQSFGLWIGADTPGIGWLMAASDNLTYPRPKLTVSYRAPLGVEQATWGTIKMLYQ